MPTNPKADQTVEIVGAGGQADYKVQVVGDQVVDLTGATPGDVLVVQADGSLAPQAAVAGGAVDSVTAASAKIVVAGTATNPTVDVGTGIPAASITGLGTMATQAASAVAISGGTVVGITDLAVADGGTGSSTAAGARTALGLGTAATSASTAFDASGAAAAAAAASQPLDSDLTAIAALTTTSFGRALLALADADAGRTALALGTAATGATGDFEATAGHTSNSVPAASGSTTLADLAMGASTILARLAAGNIVAATPAQLKTLLAIAESDVASLTSDLAALAPLASPTFTGVATAPSLSASGKTGATNQATILAGGTASGAPSTGAHVVGELVVDATGAAWYCTAAGTPGTWKLLGSGAASTANITVDVSLTANAFSDGPSLSLGAGTWRVSGAAGVTVGGAGGGWATAKIWDGSTVYRSAIGFSATDGGGVPLALMAVDIVLSGTTTIKVSATSSSTTGVLRAAALVNGTGTSGTLTHIYAVRVA